MNTYLEYGEQEHTVHNYSATSLSKMLPTEMQKSKIIHQMAHIGTPDNDHQLYHQ